MKIDPIEIYTKSKPTNWFMITVTILAVIVFINEILGNPLLDYFIK